MALLASCMRHVAEKEDGYKAATLIEGFRTGQLEGEAPTAIKKPVLVSEVVQHFACKAAQMPSQ